MYKRSHTIDRGNSVKAFTLVEVLIAIGIFLLFSGSIIALFSQSSKGAAINKHRLQASNLAREGAELIMQIKETAKLEGASWGKLQADAGSNGCWRLNASAKELVYETGAIPSGCPADRWMLSSGDSADGNANAELIDVMDNSGEIISNANRNTTVEPTDSHVRYSRIVQVSQPDADSNLWQIDVVVSWEDYGSTRSVKEVTYIANW